MKARSSSTPLVPRVAAILLAGCLGLAGCAGGNPGADSPTAAPGSGATATPSPAPETLQPGPAPRPTSPAPTSPTPSLQPSAPAPVAAPACEEILPPEAAQRVIGSPLVQFHGQDNAPAELPPSTRIGPSAQTAYAQATAGFTCAWFIPNSDGFIYFSVATLPESPRAALLASLRDSDYVEGSHSGAPTFTHDDGTVGIGVGLIRFGLVGPFLIHTEDPREGEVAHIIDGILAARPELRS